MSTLWPLFAATGLDTNPSGFTPNPVVEVFINLFYLVACGLFVLALKWLSHPATALRGVWAGSVGMMIAILGALLTLQQYPQGGYVWVVITFILGAGVGIPMAVLMPMTAVPQRTALSHAFGALAACLVG